MEKCSFCLDWWRHAAPACISINIAQGRSAADCVYHPHYASSKQVTVFIHDWCLCRTHEVSFRDDTVVDPSVLTHSSFSVCWFLSGSIALIVKSLNPFGFSWIFIDWYWFHNHIKIFFRLSAPASTEVKENWPRSFNRIVTHLSATMLSFFKIEAALCGACLFSAELVLWPNCYF